MSVVGRCTHVGSDPLDPLSAEGKREQEVAKIDSSRGAALRLYADAFRYYGEPPWSREQIIAALTVAVEESRR